MPYQEPDFLPWDGRRVPLTFVGGYLGAGKTTAINQLLATTDRPIAVLVNDVGEINVDASLIASRHGDTIELTDGCVCCTLIDGFGAAFDQIRARDTPPDHVIVELSGAADPQNVLPWGRSAGFVLDGLVVVVAADQLVPDGALGDVPQRVRDAIEAPIPEADLLVLTKTGALDPAAAGAAHQRLAELAPNTPVLVAPTAGSVEASAIGSFLALGGRRPGGAAEVAAPTLFDRHEVTRIDVPTAADETTLRHHVETALAAIDAAGDAVVVRAKGVLATADDRLWLVQVVGRRCEIDPLPMAEWQVPTGLVVITLA